MEERKMDREIFYEKIKDGYFESLSATLENFESMVNSAMQIFGKMETEVIELQTGKIITFRDIDHAMFSIGPVGYEPTEEEMDMSGTVMTLRLDKDGMIQTVEHGLRLFTPANKVMVLFLGSLIGKQITF
jgi:hypothetical protein